MPKSTGFAAAVDELEKRTNDKICLNYINFIKGVNDGLGKIIQTAIDNAEGVEASIAEYFEEFRKDIIDDNENFSNKESRGDDAISDDDQGAINEKRELVRRNGNGTVIEKVMRLPGRKTKFKTTEKNDMQSDDEFSIAVKNKLIKIEDEFPSLREYDYDISPLEFVDQESSLDGDLESNADIKMKKSSKYGVITRDKSKLKECTQCDYVATKNNHLQRHIKARHTKDREFVCEPCNKGFIEKHHLMSHQISRNCKLSGKVMKKDIPKKAPEPPKDAKQISREIYERFTTTSKYAMELNAE